MTRFIEIQDRKHTQFLSTDDLPLQVSIEFKESDSIDAGTTDQDKPNLKISKIDNNKTDSITCAYIAEDEGHLFFQPELTKPENRSRQIFHNDELIEKSVWLKSGDIIQINDQIISYKVSGDRIGFMILDKKKSTVSSPPPIDDLNIKAPENKNAVVDHQVELAYSSESNNTKKKRNNAVILILLLLISIASFVLFAETASIKIQPVADDIHLNGFLPPVKIGGRYLVWSGQYQLTAHKSGYQTLEQTLEISSQNNMFEFTMQEKPGIIQFNIDPVSHNEVFIDDVLLGNNLDHENKILQYKIQKGQHDLKVINTRYKILERNIKIEGMDKFQQFDIKLEPNWGIINISSVPDNALIEIHSDTDLIHSDSRTPSEIELMSGEYELTLSKEKYKTRKITITLKANEKLVLEPVQLEPEDGLITIRSEPANSIIRIDGQYYGKTPQSLKISPFIDHEIEVSLVGYHEQKQTIKLDPEEVKNLDIELIAKSGVVYITSSPRQAKLYIDGKLQKKSSGKFTLNENNHTITVKAQGYKSQSKKINASSYTKNLSFLLIKSSPNKAPKKLLKKSPSLSVNKKNYVNFIGQKMIRLQPSTFTMGSSKNDIGRRSNEQEHKVKLTRTFYLSEKEISNQQFKKFKPSHQSGMAGGQSLSRNTQPVVNVSWDEAAKFSNWLSKKEGLTPFYKQVNGKMTAINLQGNNNGYRLPFEAEWSFAARGKNKKKYPWSGQFPPQTVVGNFADESARSQVSSVISGYNDHNAVSSAIGNYKKNNSGFFDMGGNVSEWCQDYYSPSGTSFSNLTKVVINPTGPEKGTHKVVRDSSWKDSSITELRLSYRNYSKKAANDIGFRIARYAD